MLEELKAAAQLLQRDPVLGYSLLASLFLAAVSLSSGLARLDFLVLVKASALLRVVLLVGLAAALRVLGEVLQPPDTLLWQGAADGAWQLPLYLLALGYGPSSGLVAAGLIAAFAAQSVSLSWHEALLALKLVILGWLAIYPSPLQHRWAGPLNVALAFSLTWMTGGVALTYASTGTVDLGTLWAEQQVALVGLALAMAALLLFGPSFYRSVFADSRLTLPLPPSRQPETRHPDRLVGPVPLRRRRRPKRRLKPPPPFDGS